MEFEWDENKNVRNQEKHGLAFEDAALAFFDENAIKITDNRKDYGEQRFQLIGAIDNIAIVFVAYTNRNQNIRLISARKANKKERGLYEYSKNDTQ